MSNSLPGRDGGPFQNLEKPIPRSATMEVIAPFVHIGLHVLNRLVPAIDRRLNARQRRYIRRRLTRDMNKAAAHALMYGRPCHG